MPRIFTKFNNATATLQLLYKTIYRDDSYNSIISANNITNNAIQHIG